MIGRKRLKMHIVKAIFGCFFAMIGLFGGLLGNGLSQPVYADEEQNITTEVKVDESTDVNAESTEERHQVTEEDLNQIKKQAKKDCKKSLGEIGWLVCPATGKVAEAVDWLYGKIDDLLVINPISTADDSPVYQIWKIALSITNVIFIIFLLVVIYSQITGLGINNYGIKKILPKLIVAAILVNLSFLICLGLVDLSNIIGGALRGMFSSIGEAALPATEMVYTASGDYAKEMKLSYANMYGDLAGGAAIAIGGGVIAFETGSIWMLIPVLLGALVSVVTGLITIALRQAVVILLIMVSPLAIVSYILPNTENLYKKWWTLLKQMLVFYPMFSLLFGASNLAGYAIITSAKDGFGLIIGMAVQIFPLFYAWKMMKMSGTFLSTINAKLNGYMAGPLATNRTWAMSRKDLTKYRNMSKEHANTPSLKLMQFMSDRRIAREEEANEHKATVKNRGLAYAAKRNYKNFDKNMLPSREGEEAYSEQARNMYYQSVINRHKNNMEKGLGQLEDVKVYATTAQKMRLQNLDIENVEASDRLKAEMARGDVIKYDNAVGFHNRMEAAIGAHLDDTNGYVVSGEKRERRKGYNFYFNENDPNAIEAMSRYNTMHQIMEGNDFGIHYVAADATKNFDTQKKIIESTMQKYYDYTPTTQNLVYKLNELTVANDSNNGKAAQNIDAIIAGLRVINQRGDTDLVKNQIERLLDPKIGGGVELGSHASQALANFLMFEVKDSDPYLRRFGKYINLETARAFNENDAHPEDMRKEKAFDYDEYLKGYHKEPNGSRMYAKKDSVILVQGTSFDNIERTAMASFDDSLKKAYGFDPSVDYGREGAPTWDFEGYKRRREQIQTAIEPAFLSALSKWMSGSEQMNSGIKFWTGYELKQKKDAEGRIMLDENEEPIYDLSPSWKGAEFAGHEEEMEKYYRDKTMSLVKDQTTGQVINTRTDARDPLIAHLLKQRFLEEPGLESEYNARVNEINSRYTNLDPEEARKKRRSDLQDLKIEYSGKKYRDILYNTGKLGQIYAQRRSGVISNAKDWWRKMVLLDNPELLRHDLDQRDEERRRTEEQQQRRENTEDSGNDAGDTGGDQAGPYDEATRTGFVNDVDDFWQEHRDDDDYYEQSLNMIDGMLGRNHYIRFLYERFHSENPTADSYELREFLQNLLRNPDNYR